VAIYISYSGIARASPRNPSKSAWSGEFSEESKSKNGFLILDYSGLFGVVDCKRQHKKAGIPKAVNVRYYITRGIVRLGKGIGQVGARTLYLLPDGRGYGQAAAVIGAGASGVYCTCI
jgi:hypothetical protein